MRTIRFIASIFTVYGIIGCSLSYDDTWIKHDLEEINQRITNLEQSINSNITAVNAILKAIEANDYIISSEPYVENGVTIGYQLHFAHRSPIVIYYGKDGKDGKDGQIPAIGLKQDADGMYYWTINGEWLLDTNDNKVCASSMTPQFDIVEGYWNVSLDGGQSWSLIGKATGNDGDSFFSNHSEDNNYVYLTLSHGGTVLSIPKSPVLDIVFDQDAVEMSPGSSKTITYSIISAITPIVTEVIASNGLQARVISDVENGLSGSIVIESEGDISEYSRLIVLVSDGQKVIMKILHVSELGVLQVSGNQTIDISDAGGDVELAFLTNIPYEVTIPAEAQNWLSVIPKSKAVEKHTVGIRVAKNNGGQRSSSITISSKDNKLSIQYKIAQSAIALSGFENGHEWVDLGLPSGIKWATYNVGATTPEGFGGFYAWGETATKTNYSYSTYKWGEYKKFTKYNSFDKKSRLEQTDDAAHWVFGGNWRTPSEYEWKELIYNCNWKSTKLNNVQGMLVSSKINNNSIFLPIDGIKDGLSTDSSVGAYWSSDCSVDNGFGLFITSNNTNIKGDFRNKGCRVRPVLGDNKVTGINLNNAEITLIKGEKRQIVATYAFSNTNEKATNWDLIWSTGSSSIVTVTDNGLVTAVGAGTTTVTATTVIGGYSATCTITVPVPTTLNDHQWVDLGLPSGLKWATCNLGALKPEDFGNYYAWGELSPKSTYSDATYKFYTHQGLSQYKINKYNTDSNYGTVDNKKQLELQDDAAYISWGSGWRMPTKDELEELVSYCSFSYIEYGTIKGVLVTSIVNGNSIFFPLAGYRVNDEIMKVDSSFDIRSSTLGSLSWTSCVLTYLNSKPSVEVSYSRDAGYSIRPVAY